MNKIGLVMVLALTSTVLAVPDANPLIYAPQVSGVSVDGDLSDWSAASDWAVFGAWDGNPPGLASTTKAQYAWSDANDVLYVGIESTEGIGLFLELGGLLGVTGEPNEALATATPYSPAATQISFSNWVGGVPGDIVNQIGETTVGVNAAYTFAIDGSVVTLTIELSVPIYANWSNPGSAFDLQHGMDVYVFANVFDSTGDYGDSQVADGSYVRLWDGIVMQEASLVRLLNTGVPQVCDDIPDPFKPEFDFDHNCYVDLADFGIFAAGWVGCNDPEDAECTPNW